MIGVLDAPRIVDVPDEAQPMKLSDAMRIGSQLRGKCKYNYYDSQSETTCALGAAFEAVTGKPEWLPGCDSVQIDEYFPALRNDSASYTQPVTGNPYNHLYNVIIQLNDDYDWTRQEIADWLEGQGL